MTEEQTVTIPKVYWIVAGVALVWNLMGVFNFFSQVLMSEETLAAMPEAEQALYNAIPTWLNVIFGLAVFSGLIGCIGLLVKKEFATLFFLISLIAVLLHMGYTTFFMNTAEVMGGGTYVMALLVTLFAAFLYYWTMKGLRKGWLTE